MSDYAVLTDRLTREFSTVRALDELTLEIPVGSVFGFLGSNGAGKTTTIQLLLGLLPPTSGTAEVLGLDVTKHADEIRGRTGALLDQAGLYQRLSVQDNLDLYGRIWHMARRARRARAEELLRQLDLWERRKEPAGRLSFGMKRKLAVARALFHRPRLVFLDEPTAGLDLLSAAALRRSLVDLAREEGLTVFLTTHNVPEAGRVCDRVGIIRDGKLLAVGTPDDLRTAAGRNFLSIRARRITERVVWDLHQLREVNRARLQDGELRLELTPGASAARVVASLVRSGAEVEEVTRGSSLEDAFLFVLDGRDGFDTAVGGLSHDGWAKKSVLDRSASPPQVETGRRRA